MSDLETMLKCKMEWVAKANSCGTCHWYNEGSYNEEGPGSGCFLNGALRIQTTSNACCKHWEIRQTSSDVSKL